MSDHLPDLYLSQSASGSVLSQSAIIVPDFSTVAELGYVEIDNFEVKYIRQVFTDENGNETEYFIVRKNFPWKTKVYILKVYIF